MSQYLSSLKIVKVLPCVDNRCYTVEHVRNNNDEVLSRHVEARNPYHAVNKAIKDICASEGTTRFDVYLDYDDRYLAGWNGNSSDGYTYTPEAVVPEQKKVLAIARVTTNQYNDSRSFGMVWIKRNPDGSEIERVYDFDEPNAGYGVTADTEDAAVEKFIAQFSKEYTVVDERPARPVVHVYIVTTVNGVETSRVNLA